MWRTSSRTPCTRKPTATSATPSSARSRSTKSDDPQGYADCTSSLGVAVKSDDAVCRIFYPIKCPAGVLELARVGAHTCRAVKRRNWTCGAGYLAGNRFPICFRKIEFAAGEAVPACQGKVPDLGAFKEGERACETYVGSDVLAAPGEIACSAYTTGDFEGLTGFTRVAMQANPDNAYWCRFDAAKLTLNCHGPNQPASGCAQQDAMCLKRASRTGGCDQIIETVRCRAYQTAFAQSRIDIAAVRDQGCVPCVNLPFQSPTCQDETTRQTDRYGPVPPLVPGTSAREAILRCRVDFTTDPSNRWYPADTGRQPRPLPGSARRRRDLRRPAFGDARMEQQPLLAARGGELGGGRPHRRPAVRGQADPRSPLPARNTGCLTRLWP